MPSQSHTLQACGTKADQTRCAVPNMESVMQTSPRAKSETISKDPDEWTTGDEPMTPSQASYLKTLCEQAGDDRSYARETSQ
ncbi:DUF3072 domain-containing protein [Mesorhizobium sp. LSJC265A00]|uniref:DUF3072 domain-containing protein n=1 Tax=Mesorhizobium sp. LSJC265A00 TaxID=1287322 RepID=UPI004037A7ED